MDELEESIVVYALRSRKSDGELLERESFVLEDEPTLEMVYGLMRMVLKDPEDMKGFSYVVRDKEDFLDREFTYYVMEREEEKVQVSFEVSLKAGIHDIRKVSGHDVEAYKKWLEKREVKEVW